MNTFLYNIIDTTIYKHTDFKNINTGLDEILEVSNMFSETSGHTIGRSLIYFDVDSSKFTSDKINYLNFFLNLKITESYELTGNLVIEFLPLKTTWEEGYGRKFDNVVSTNGATWNSTGQTDWKVSGGDYYEEHELEQNFGIPSLKYKFKKRISDISVNITDYVNLWNAGILENNGIIIKFKTETSEFTGNIKFFSKDTNTIYYPYINVSHNDYEFDPCGCREEIKIECAYIKNNESHILTSGSSSNDIPSGSHTSGSYISGSNYIGNDGCTNESGIITYLKHNVKPAINFISTEQLSISLKNLKSNISVKEQLKIRVGVREKYPIKTFPNKKSRYTSTNFIEHPMYYSVVDSETKERVLDFSKYTRVSCDSRGHYFDFDFGVLKVDRIYFFEVRIESSDQIENFIIDKSIRMVR